MKTIKNMIFRRTEIYDRYEYLGAVQVGYLDEEIDHHLQEYQFTIYLNGIIGAIVSVVVLLFVGNKVLLPIRSLTLAATGLAAGDWNYPIEEYSNDELGKLARAFKTMQAAIKSQIKSIKKANQYVTAIIECMPEILISVDENGSVTRWNSAARTLFGNEI